MNSGSGSNAQSIIILVVLLIVMYFMLIRPQNKKDKKDKEMRNNLQVGDEIMTVGGIYGQIIRIKDDRLTIASGAEKTKLEITKTAVANKMEDQSFVKSSSESKDSKASPKKIKRLGKKEADAPVETPVAEEEPVVAETQAEEIVATEE